jgi:Flp pilus assembly protein TadD
MWEVTAVTALALAAIAVAAIPRFGPPAASRLPLRVAVPVVAAIALFAQVPGLVSTSKVRDSREAFNSGRTAEALSNAGEAIEAEPWGSTPYVQRALVEEATGELRAAQVDLRRAIERSRLDWRPWLLLARVEAKRGNVERALTAYRTARRLRPASPFVRQGTFNER